MAAENESNEQSGILNLELTDKSALYAAYMPFVENGGLFIPVRGGAAAEYALGDELFLLLRLRMDDVDERLPTPGRVVWITPAGAQGQRAAGVGIQFSSKDGGTTQQRIETILAGSVNAEQPTNTL